MSKKFQLQIPDPCHESWDKMTPVDKGRFCDSCQKAVVDFTGMSDSQLIAYFRKPSTGSICGRFYNDQLERDFEMPRKRLPWVKYFFQFVIPVFLTGYKSYSQGESILKNTTSVCTDTSSNQTVVFGNSISPIRNEILGNVIDENGKGIPYASVIIKGTRGGVSCDSSGNFYLRIPEKKKQISLVASSIGYETTESVITTRSNLPQAIKLKSGISLNNEVVVVAMGYTRQGMVTRTRRGVKKSYLERVKDYFIKDSFTVFPNPAKAGREIKIEWKKADAGDHLIELYDSQGQLIESKATKIETQATFVTFHLPFITAGTYILRLTNKKTGKKQIEKIIIQ